MFRSILKLVEYTIILTAVALLAYVLGVQAGVQHALDYNDRFVNLCHAKSEDSPPTDCDYHDGAWWPRGSADGVR